jgi:pyridoxal phosphate enzyme (YggS family)
MSIQQNLQRIEAQLAATQCRLIAVTKTQPIEALQEAYNAGSKRFGENKVQEMTAKYEQLPKDIEWHLIGHLQSNKVKFIAPFVSLIHSVDSLKLLQEINRQALKNNRVINCLLQMHIAQEETKFGLSESEAKELLQSAELRALTNIRLVGLMGMATNTNDLGQIRHEFRGLKQLYDELGNLVQQSDIAFSELSMGMSGDYAIAIEEGSTLIRVGSAIFGVRQ